MPSGPSADGTEEEPAEEQQAAPPDEEAPPCRPCPQCGAPMRFWRRSAMTRCGGLVLIYAAALFFLLCLRSLGPVHLVVIVLLVGTGCTLAARRERWWCPRCQREWQAEGPGGKES